MSRPFKELLDDFQQDPTPWEVVQSDVQPSTNTRNRGGSSIEDLLRHMTTGEEMVRHTVLKPNGTIFRAPHFRPKTP